MAAALADLDRQITAAGPERVSVVCIPILESTVIHEFIQKGGVITVTAPTGGPTSGVGVMMGSLFVVAFTAAEGDPLEIATSGVYELPKDPGMVLASGDPVAWDDTASSSMRPVRALPRRRRHQGSSERPGHRHRAAERCGDGGRVTPHHLGAQVLVLGRCFPTCPTIIFSRCRSKRKCIEAQEFGSPAPIVM